jgi:methylenetetrahydrofolate dehydrogenase (NADP+)/methenyltetrahydrofolate cyclohydrolase
LWEIDPFKDADGLSTKTLGMVFQNFETGILPATPMAVIEVLKDIYETDDLKGSLAGKKVLIINRSYIVGRPLAAELINLDATVTVAHSKSGNIKELSLNSDIVISGTGVSKFLTGDMINEGAVVIDVGINKTAEGVAGDIDIDSVNGKAGYLTPVPGGVGPLTVAMLFRNLVKLTKLQSKI